MKSSPESEIAEFPLFTFVALLVHDDGNKQAK